MTQAHGSTDPAPTTDAASTARDTAPGVSSTTTPQRPSSLSSAEKPAGEAAQPGVDGSATQPGAATQHGDTEKVVPAGERADDSTSAEASAPAKKKQKTDVSEYSRRQLEKRYARGQRKATAYEVLTGVLGLVLAWFVWDRAALTDSPYAVGTLLFAVGFAALIVLAMVRRMINTISTRRGIAVAGVATGVTTFVIGLIITLTVNTDAAAAPSFFTDHLLDVSAPAVVLLAGTLVFVWFLITDRRELKD
ncbi:TIGR04086 family membrane protein [Actinotignum schaalii]|uniref:Uncharacterized protein n=1 Tax=Actinotignum schaalii FB123-CNA-2 TaxID=883067 RepID=S2VJC7_9ACTO|nr:TIGR04086 family membrane protein [Actinotignum schaalii]EPD26085.1 hypothetical protein HMPREF9237_01360 [Actinotignum schaalii FB123-CNA-2]